MIHLEVEDYCHGCNEFEADVNTSSLFVDGSYIGADVAIRCEHRKKCANIVRHLKEKNENLEDKEGTAT